MQMNIVAIGAHPDDLEIFTFGFLAAASARGDRLFLGVATDGAAGGENPWRWRNAECGDADPDGGVG